MNYEELLASRNGATMKKDSMPFGALYKKMSGDSYSNVIDLRYELSDSLRFCEALKAESEQLGTVSDRHQLHFAVTTDSSGMNSVTVEKGSFNTFERMIEDKPSIVAGKHFVEETMEVLFESVGNLNRQGIYHLCFAPANILVRKGDTTPLLLFHGSSYLLLNDQEALYGQYKDYVAPEVLEEGVANERSEVYSLGKFMEYLYHDSSIPFEYRPIMKKATQQDPQKRYKSPEAMQKAMKSNHALRSSLITGVAAVLLAVVCIGIYMELTPEAEEVEFVESAPKENFDDVMFQNEYDPNMELDATQVDSSVTHVDEQQMKVYEAKAEQIFRKRYAKEAERILSKIYDNEHMNSSEKRFLSESTTVMEELTKKQIEMGSEAGLNDTKSQRIASEIIEKISNEKKAKLEQYGVQKEKEGVKKEKTTEE